MTKKRLAIDVAVLVVILVTISVVLQITTGDSLPTLIIYWIVEAGARDYETRVTAEIIFAKQESYYKKHYKYASDLDELKDNPNDAIGLIGIDKEFLWAGESDYKIKVSCKAVPDKYYIVSRNGVTIIRND